MWAEPAGWFLAFLSITIKNCCNYGRATIRGGFIEGSFLVNSAVKSVNQMRRPDSKGLRNSQECPYGDRPPRLNLLPMTGREAKTNHVLLRITMSLTKFLNSNS